jgi:hypothetical protein
MKYACLLMCGLTGFVCAGEISALDEWIPSKPLVIRSAPQAIAFGRGQFVVVGENGSIYRSLDGAAWAKQQVPLSGNFRAVIFGNGIFAAPATNRTMAISTNGIDWSVLRLPLTFDTICYGNGEFLAMADENPSHHSFSRVFVSGNGVTWTEPTIIPQFPSFDHFNAVTWFKNRYVALGRSGFIWNSIDGRTWAASTRFSIPLTCFAQNDDLLVAAGYYGFLQLSTDGLNWTPPTSTIGSVLIKALAYGNGTFVAAGNTGPKFLEHFNHGAILTSTNGLVWTHQPSFSSHELNALAYGNGIFVASSPSGALGTSTNGMQWRQRTTGTNTLHRSIAFGNGLFVAVGDSSSYADQEEEAIATSPDGLSWTEQFIDGQGAILNAAAFGHGQFVAVAENGLIYTSPDGANWTFRRARSAEALLDVAFGNDRFVAVGVNRNTTQYIILVSTNGTVWTESGRGPGLWFDNVIYADQRFVASAISSPTGGAALFSSPDGLAWTRHDINETLIELAYGNGVFVASAFYQTSNPAEVGTQVISSSDGINWTRRMTFPNNSFVRGLAYGNGRFVAAGSAMGSNQFALWTSANGQDWTGTWRPGRPTALYSARYLNNVFVAVGDGIAVRSGTPGDNTPKPYWLSVSGIPGTETHLQVETIRGREIAIESSMDLRLWTGQLQTNVPAGVTEITLPLGIRPHQFFRARAAD